MTTYLPRWRLSFQENDFAAQFHALITTDRNDSTDVRATVRDLIQQVRTHGDQALADLTQRFDQTHIPPGGSRLNLETRDALAGQISQDQRAALGLAADRIRAFHDHQRPTDLRYTDQSGVDLGYRWTPISRIGIYVPGGRAAYPSSLLMAAIPASVAGVKSIAMTLPAPQGYLAPLVMAAAQLLGIEEIYQIGGAQAIAALAYGTDTISPVDMIVGPGNAYVAEAKRQVFGQVGIDMVAGPSEILIIADGNQNPDWIAADLLSQCEHDPSAQAILLTPCADMLTRVEHAVDQQLAALPSQSPARESWQRHGALIHTKDLAHAAALCDAIAPEHLELAVADPDGLFERICHAGSVFLGAYTPEPLGDYLAGPNHILPTMGTARFSGGLGVHTFMKRTTFLSANPRALATLGPTTQTLALAEGLPAHAHAIAIRGDQA